MRTQHILKLTIQPLKTIKKQDSLNINFIKKIIVSNRIFYSKSLKKRKKKN